MNQKIESLLNRAGMNRICHDDAVLCTNEQLEIFAALIVNECALVVEAAIYHKLPINSFAKLISEEFN